MFRSLVLFGVPYETVLGPLTFTVFVIDLFYILNNLDYESLVNSTSAYAAQTIIKFFIKDLFSKCDQTAEEKLHFEHSVVRIMLDL